MAEREISDFTKKKSAKRVVEPVKKKSKVEVTKPKKKTKVVDTPVKKKLVKKTKSTEKPVKKKKLSRATTEGKLAVVDAGKGLIEKGMAVIERMDNSIFDKNREQADEYATMFKHLVKMSRMAEKQYYKKKQSRDIYALMKLYDQMREVIADMRALQDVGEYIAAMDHEVLRPVITQAAASLLELVRHIKDHCTKTLTESEAKSLIAFVNKQGKTTGIKIHESYRSALENSRRILVG